jgi:large subunit ribosomal protein L3
MKLGRSGIIAKKIAMTQIFDKNGQVTPVTLIEVVENVVLSVTPNSNNNYSRVQLAAYDQKSHRVSKSVAGIFKNLNVLPKRKIKEFKIHRNEPIHIGQSLSVEYFKKGQYVDITGTSIGKGYSGVMKRHNFKGLEASHGVSSSHRSAGSTGQCQDPGRVFKEKKMSGQLGNKKVTKQNIFIVDIDTELNLLVVRGAVPGCKNSYLYVRDAIKKTFLYIATKV